MSFARLRSAMGPFVTGLGIAMLTWGAEWLMQPWLGPRVPFLLFLPVVIVLAATLGRAAALPVLLAGALHGLMSSQSGDTVTTAETDRYALAAYLIVSAVMLLVAGRVRLVTRRAAEAERRLAMAQTDTGVGLFEVDFAAKTVFVSREMTQLLGQSPTAEQVPLSRWVQMLPPDEVEKGSQALKQKLLEGADRYEREHRIVLPDGGVRWLLSRVHIHHGRDGRALRIRGASVDITQRKELDAALRQARDDLTQQVADLQRLHELSSELPELPDLQAQLGAILRALCDFHGTRQGLVSLFRPDDRSLAVEASLGFTERALERLDGVRAGQGACGIACGEGRRVVVEDTREDATFEDFRGMAEQEGFRAVHSTPLIGSADEVLGAISVHFPLPRRPSKRETRLADICARKASVFIERARAQDALHEADRRKDEFLATLAHELRNPLAPIRQAAVIAQAPAATEAQKRWSHAIIERQVQQMALLLDDLLDVSRITRGTLQLRKSAIALADVVDAAVETARPVIDARRHQLGVELPAVPTIIDADPLRMAQVFANLLTNAAKYTDPGGSIRLVAARAGEQVVLKVIDNGIGLRKDVLGEIFRMFTQVRTSEDRSAGGLGIGLALAKGLVELHGGQIEASSDGPGKGSTFTVRLPVVQAATGASVPTAPALPFEAVRRKVLVADDNRDAAESLAALLRLDGHEVAIAYDGEEALAEFARFHPDVALLDIGMPKLSGNAVAGAIRQSAQGKSTTLVAVTGWGQEKDRSEALAAGFDHHLTKPVDPQRVHELLRS